MRLDTIEIVTLFVDDIEAANIFYSKVFAPEVLYRDEVSTVLKFAGVMINLLQAAQAPQLVAPLVVAASSAGARALFTIRVDNVDAACAHLDTLGIKLLNGPLNRPWGRRTAAFADPSGHVWEFAEQLA